MIFAFAHVLKFDPENDQSDSQQIPKICRTVVSVSYTCVGVAWMESIPTGRPRDTQIVLRIETRSGTLPAIIQGAAKCSLFVLISRYSQLSTSINLTSILLRSVKLFRELNGGRRFLRGGHDPLSRRD